MHAGDLPEDFATSGQLKKYAEDLRELYKSEKDKRKDLTDSYRQLLKYAEDLGRNFQRLKTAHDELREAYLDTIQRLVLAAEYKDEDTADHIVRMSRYCFLLAQNLGLPDEKSRDILYASPMHDVGKIGIPDAILMKPGRLTAEEFESMKAHTTIGARIIGDASAEILKLAEEVALVHHEKWNGKGYPRGLAGTDIPMSGRIAAVADVFDALTSRRPYKDPFPVEKALGIIREERGQHFDPDVVDVFLESFDSILEIKEEVVSYEAL
jgi:putative two-component system response regulator